MCKSVDLPAPEGATSATDWPGQMASSAPLRMSCVTSTWRWCRSISARTSIGGSPSPRATPVSDLDSALIVSLIAQRLDRIEARRAPGRIKRRQQRQHERHYQYRRGLAGIEIGGEFRQKKKIGGEQIRIFHPRQEKPERLTFEGREQSQ